MRRTEEISKRIRVGCDDQILVSAFHLARPRSHQIQVVRSQERHRWLDGAQLCEAGESALRHRSRHKLEAIVQRLVLGLVEKGGESVLLEGLRGNENIRGNGEADVRVQRGGLQTQETGGKEKKGLRDGL